MAVILNNDPTKINKVVACNVAVNVRSSPTDASAENLLFTAKKSTTVGRSTGTIRIEKEKNRTWYQVALYKSVTDASGVSKQFGWVISTVTKLVEPPKETKITALDAEKIVKELAEYDEKTYHNLLFISGQILYLKQKKVDVTAYEKQRDLLLRKVKERQRKIKESKFLKFDTGFRKSYTTLVNKFKGLFSSIGEPVTVSVSAGAIIVGSLVLIGSAALIYYYFISDHGTAKIEWKQSEEVKAILSKLSPTDRAKVEKEVTVQLNDAYSKGNSEGKWDGAMKVIKPLAFAAAGFFLVDKFLSSRTTKAAA